MRFNQTLIQQLKDEEIALYGSNSSEMNLVRDILKETFPKDTFIPYRSAYYYFRSTCF